MIFYISAALAIVSTLLVVLAKNAVHALLYFIVSLLAVSVIFFLIGAPFIAALEVIIYAGAIMVLFVFVIMMLQVHSAEYQSLNDFTKPAVWAGPAFIALILFGEMLYVMFSHSFQSAAVLRVSAQEVGTLLFTQYAIVVDLAGFLLAAGIVGAYHLGQKEKTVLHRYLTKTDEP